MGFNSAFKGLIVFLKYNSNVRLLLLYCARFPHDLFLLCNRIHRSLVR